MNPLQAFSFTHNTPPAVHCSTAPGTQWPSPDEPSLSAALLRACLHGGAAGTVLGLGAAMLVRLMA